MFPFLKNLIIDFGQLVIFFPLRYPLSASCCEVLWYGHMELSVVLIFATKRNILIKCAEFHFIKAGKQEAQYGKICKRFNCKEISPSIANSKCCILKPITVMIWTKLQMEQTHSSLPFLQKLVLANKNRLPSTTNDCDLINCLCLIKLSQSVYSCIFPQSVFTLLTDHSFNQLKLLLQGDL